MAKEIIQYADIVQMQQILAQTNQLVSGMTAEQAVQALNLANYGPVLANNITVFPDPKKIAEGAATASEAYLAYGAAGGALSAAGAATVGYGTTATITAIAAGGGAIGVAGLVSLAPPVAIAVGLAVLGYAAGQLAYQADPAFWDGLYEKVKKFCFPNTDVVPGVVDADYNVYIDQGIVDTLSDALGNYHPSEYATSIVERPFYADNTIDYPVLTNNISAIKVQYIDGTVGEVPITNRNVIVAVIIGKFIDSAGKSSYEPIIFACDQSPFQYYTTWAPPIAGGPTTYDAVQVTENGKTYYGAVFNPLIGGATTFAEIGLGPSAMKLNYQSEYSPSTRNNTLANREKMILYDILFGSPGVSLPEGLEIYPGTTGISSAIGLITGSIGSLVNRPYTGVELTKITSNPWETTSDKSNGKNDPEIINPYIPPEISPNQYPNEIPTPKPDEITSPIPTPSTTTKPDLNPNANPSAEPEPAPQPDPEPAPSTPPSTGDAPLEPFPPPEFPSIVSAGGGLIHVYNPTAEEMISFGKWLWVTLQEGGFGIGNYQRLWNNPFDGVIGAFELYANPTVNGRDSIRSGFLACPTQADLVSVRYFNIDCGSLVVPEYYGNYLDYSPYTKAHIYLPFVGIVELNCDDIIGHGVNVTYRIDAYNGSCIATITVAKDNYNALMYQFSGSCAVELPLAGGSQAAIKAGLIGAAATGISSVVTGIAGLATGSIGMMAGGISGIGNAISHAVSSKSSVQHSGAFGDSCGAMGNKKPYIIIHRPIQKYVPNYNQIYGYPAHTLVTIGNCTGFLRVREIHVESSQATDEEKARIEQMLKEGVIVS